jgi:hypothetical protein
MLRRRLEKKIYSFFRSEGGFLSESIEQEVGGIVTERVNILFGV